MRGTLRVLSTRRAIVSILATGAGCALVAPGSAGAGEALYAAIAVDQSNGEYGFSFDRPTRANAERGALRECRARSNRGGCRNIVWVRNACAAVAVRKRHGSITRIAWGIGDTKRQAVERARDRAARRGRGRIDVLAWVCTSREAEPDPVLVTGRDSWVHWGTSDRRPLTDPFDGLWTAGDSANGASASQTSNVQAAASGVTWMTMDGSALTDGTPNAFSTHTVTVDVPNGTARLTCTANWSFSGGTPNVENEGSGFWVDDEEWVNGSTHSVVFDPGVHNLYAFAAVHLHDSARAANVDVNCQFNRRVAIAPNG